MQKGCLTFVVGLVLISVVIKYPYLILALFAIIAIVLFTNKRRNKSPNVAATTAETINSNTLRVESTPVSIHNTYQPTPLHYNENYSHKKASLNESLRLNKKIRNFLPDSFVVIDFETTGLDPVSDKIVEMGAVKYINGEHKDSFSSLINPEVSISPYITSINGITNAMVKNAPKIKDKLPQFVDFIGDLPIVAHNADFDMKFFKSNALEFDVDISNPYIDTLYLCRKFYPEFENHKLGTVCTNLCINQDTAHRSLEDCMSTAKVYLKCREYEQTNKNEIYGTGTAEGAETTEFELEVFEKVKDILIRNNKPVEHIDYIDTKKNFSIVYIGPSDMVYEIAKFTIGARKKYFTLTAYGKKVLSINKLSKLIHEEYSYELDNNNNVKIIFNTVDDLSKFCTVFIEQYESIDKLNSR